MVIRFGQIVNCTYFIASGNIEVYVVNENGQGSYLFDAIGPGGSFNFINSFLGHSSLFQIVASDDCKLAKLFNDDLMKISRKKRIIFEELQLLKSKYM